MNAPFRPWRMLPMFRTRINLQGSAPYSISGIPVPPAVDEYGAMWTRSADGQNSNQTNRFDLFSTPAAATQATATQATAGPGKRNVLTSLTVTVNAVAAQGVQTVVVRDGATGVGTILWSITVGPLGAAQSAHIPIPFPNGIVGSSNVAMTIELTGAPAATNFNSIAGAGFVAG